MSTGGFMLRYSSGRAADLTCSYCDKTALVKYRYEHHCKSCHLNMLNIKSQDFMTDRQDIHGHEKAWKLLLTEADIKAVVQNIAKEINMRFAGKNIIIVCILKGCAWFFTDLTKLLTIPYSTYFIEVSSYKNEQTNTTSELLSLINPDKFKNKTVILLDELYDSGNTLTVVQNAISLACQLPSDSPIFTCTLFKKKRITKSVPDLFGIKIPDVWVVGYGLDDKQEKRGWPHLYACPKAAGMEHTKADDIFESDEKYFNERVKLINQFQ